MADTQWGDEEQQLPKKKRIIPVWVLACGGSCLGVILIAVLAFVLMFDKLKGFVENMADPEVQWPKVAEVLPFEERPDVDQIFGFNWPIPPLNTWTMIDQDDAMIYVLMDIPASEGDDIGEVFDPDKSFDMFGLNKAGARHDAEVGTMVVQGRELMSMRYYTESAEDRAQAEAEAEAAAGPDLAGQEANEIAGQARGAGLFLDLTPPGSDRFLILQAMRWTSQERISDAEIGHFLAPFHVGPEHPASETVPAIEEAEEAVEAETQDY